MLKIFSKLNLKLATNDKATRAYISETNTLKRKRGKKKYICLFKN